MSLINTAYKFTNLVSNCVFSLFVIKKNIDLFSDGIKILEPHINKEVLNIKNETQSNLVLDAIYGVIITFINIFAKDNHHLRVVSISIFDFIKKYMNFLGHNLELDKLVNLEYEVHMYILILIPIILITIFIYYIIPNLTRLSKRVFSQRLNRVDRIKYNLLAQKLLTYTSIKKKIRFLLVIVDYISQHQTQTLHTYEYWNNIIKDIFKYPIEINSINKFLLKLSREIPNECVEHIKNRIRYNEILSPFVQINGPGTGDVFERRYETDNFKNSYLQLLKKINI